LINDELEYFKELKQINQEERSDSKSYVTQFRQIKQKLVNLVDTITVHQRVTQKSEEPSLANMSHLKVQEQLKLTKKGERHQSLRASFVDNAVKTSMMPADEEFEKEITDRYPLHPFVQDGNSFNLRTQSG
jgi:hypothetical protein